MEINIGACIRFLRPGEKYNHADESLGYDSLIWLDTTTKPTLEELEVVWLEVELVEREAQKRGAYRTEADPLYAEWQALLAAGHSDAEARHQEWLAKRAEIAARFP